RLAGSMDEEPTKPTTPWVASADPRFYPALGRAIKVLRTERGLGRRELAELAEVSYPYLSEIENGKKRASSKALVAIAAALGLRPSQLLESAESFVGAIAPEPSPAPAPP